MAQEVCCWGHYTTGPQTGGFSNTQTQFVQGRFVDKPSRLLCTVKGTPARQIWKASRRNCRTTQVGRSSRDSRSGHPDNEANAGASAIRCGEKETRSSRNLSPARTAPTHGQPSKKSKNVSNRPSRQSLTPKAVALAPPVRLFDHSPEDLAANGHLELGHHPREEEAGAVLLSFMEGTEEGHTGGHRVESKALWDVLHEDGNVLTAIHGSDEIAVPQEVDSSQTGKPSLTTSLVRWWPKWLPPLTAPQDAAILGLAGPALLALAADPLLSLVDTAFVGRLGHLQLAALGVDTAIFSFSFVVFNFLATATTPAVATSLASGNKEQSGRTITQALAIAGVLGVLVALGLHFGSDGAIALMGAGGEGPELQALAKDYLQVRATAAPAVLLATVAQGSFRGLQDMKTPLAVTVGANVINLVLDPILIFGFGWGVTGAGAATAVAEWASAIGYGAVMWQRREEFGLTESTVLRAIDWKRRREAFQELVPFVSAGSAVLLRTVVLLGTKTLASAVATRDGATSIAAHQVAAQLWLLGSLLVDSLAVSGQALVAVELGAGDKKAARAVSDRLLQFGLALGTALGLLYAIGAPVLAASFTDDTKVLQAVEDVLPIVIFMQPMNALVFVMDGLFVGASDFRYLASAMVISTAGSAGLLLAVEPMGWGLTGVWGALVLLMVMRGVTLGVRYNSRDGPLPPVQDKIE